MNIPLRVLASLRAEVPLVHSFRLGVPAIAVGLSAVSLPAAFASRIPVSVLISGFRSRILFPPVVQRMPLQSLTHAAGRCERRPSHAVPAETSLPRRQKAQGSMFNVPSSILINKVCFPFARLGASASEGAVVVRPVPRGPYGPRMRRSRHLSVSCAFLRFFWRNPSHDASQCRSVFRKKYGFCDIFRCFLSWQGPLKSVFLAESPPYCRFSACFVLCNAVVFSVYLEK